jgi:hypothetical protein
MKSHLQILTLFCLFFFVITGFAGATGNVPIAPTNSTNSTTIIKQLPSEQELNNFITGENYSAYFTNIATLDAIKKHPTWPHDIWSDPNGEFYISFYYKDDLSPAGYTSIYYDDSGRKLQSVCKISFKLIEPYYGLNVTETQSNGSTVTQVISVTNETVVRVAENNTMYPLSNQETGIQSNNTQVCVNNSGNNGTIAQQNAGGSIWDNIVIYAQNLYLNIVEK